MESMENGRNRPTEFYTPEEFIKSLKRRGIVKYINDARKYVKETGKEQYTEDDFETAWRALNGGHLGREFIRDQVDGETVIYQRGWGEFYWRYDQEKYKE